MTDRWIAECRRILAEGRARRDGQHLRTAPRAWPPTAPTTRRDTGAEDSPADVTPPPEAWTPSSVLDDIPLPDEPPEEDWRR